MTESARKEMEESQGPVLPLARIKRIMKKDPDVKNMSKEALFLTTMGVERFISELSKAATKHLIRMKQSR